MKRLVLLLACVSHAGLAQVTPQPGPAFDNVDDNGVDLVTGQYRVSMTEGSIGSGDATMALARYWGDGVWRDNWSGILYLPLYPWTDFTAYVELGGTTDRFTTNGSTYTSTEGNGATLVQTQNYFWLYTSSQGVKVVYHTEVWGNVGTGSICAKNAVCAIPVSVTLPNGVAYTLSIDHATKCEYVGSACNQQEYHRFRRVDSSAGYSVTVNYATDDPGSQPTIDPNWLIRSEATFTHGSPDTCGGICPALSYSTSGPLTITDALGRATRFTSTAGRITAIKRPGSASLDTTSVSYDANGRVSSIINDGVTTTYSFNGTGTVTVMTAAGTTTVVSDLTKGRVTQVTDPLNRTTAYTYDTSSRLTETTLPEGNKRVLGYDARGNVISATSKAKPGSGLADISTTANFPASCTSPASCNKPSATTDARGNTTDYVYEATTGQPVSVTLPAPAGGGTRPQTRYGYTVNGGGTSLLTSISACRTLASCSGGADEVKTSTAYDASLNVTSVTTGAGDNSLTVTNTYTYDAAGNRTYVDGPLSGAADKTRVLYNADRETTGVIGPDPDGGGSRVPLAQRITYNSDGQPTQVEAGTVADASDSAWAAFSSAQQAVTTYDSNARAVKAEIKAGGTTYSVTQQSYDALGRMLCSAQRMDPAQWGSQTDACVAQTTGANGADRIVRPAYDALGRVTTTTAGYGTSEAAVAQTNAYTTNGKLASVKDAESNLTTYEYDGYDRQLITRYPVTTAGANSSSTTDYEQLSYDANSKVTQRRLRDGGTITFAYDNLNRPISATPIGELAVTYQYDLTGQLTQVQRAGDSQTVTLAYDALGRLLSESQPFGSAIYQYDSAGRLTRITWADGFYVTYDYDVAGNVTAIRENGAASGVGVLATYTYDNFGRRTGISRGNGTSTSYAFDPVSRLSSTTQDLSGNTNDQTIGSIAYNPSSQIQSQVKSNDAYAWTGHYNVNRNYTVNGLNQQTASGATALGYDGRGNLTNSGTNTYTYNKLNQLTGGPGSTALTYDPAQRLDQIVGSSGTTRFAYVGSAMIQEASTSGTILRRYVPGPGMDEALVWYEGSGTTDRRWLHADERGSVIAVSDASGAMLNINRYDEYGIPQSTNVGRFQYTGQAWLPELGMYYYKARMYSPTLGRFMQTDPIGYGDGLNWYNYANSDPVNRIDPTGTENGPDTYAPPAILVCGGGLVNIGGRCAPRPEPPSWFTSIVMNSGRSLPPIEPMPLFNLPQKWHRYPFSRRLTKANTRCTGAQVSGAVNRNIVPGSYGNHFDGKSYRVYAPGGFSPGTIRFRSNAAGTVFQNVTNSDHVLRYGSVTTTIGGNQSGGFSASGIGEGTNINWFTAEANYAFGPDIFADQLDAAAKELEGLCGG